jgi:hypothetical protein
MFSEPYSLWCHDGLFILATLYQLLLWFGRTAVLGTSVRNWGWFCEEPSGVRVFSNSFFVILHMSLVLMLIGCRYKSVLERLVYNTLYGIRSYLHSHKASLHFFSTGFYSPYRTLAFLNGLLDPQTFGRTPWLGDQSNTRPLPKHRTTRHRNTQTHPCPD